MVVDVVNYILVFRIPYSTNGMSTYQVSRRIILSGDIQTNPGPGGKRAPKYPCKQCEKNVGNNQDALLCAECNVWSHEKCLGMSKTGFKYYLDNPELDWTCSLCSLPFRTVDNIHGAFTSNQNHELSNDSFHLGSETSMNMADDNDSLMWYYSNITSYYKYNLKIAYLNINSLINKTDEVKDMLNKEMFDILFIAETKIDKTVSSSLLSQSGFRIVRKDRKKGAGGLLAYIRTDLSVYRRAKMEPANIETNCLDVKDNNKSRFLVCACYRSPGKCKESDFLAELAIASESMFRSRKELLLIGDMNMDMYVNTGEGRTTNRNLVDFCSRYCLVNKVSEPTRVTDKSKTLIDVALASHQERYSTVGSLHLGVSDHDLVYVIRKNKLARPKLRLIEYRSMKFFDHSKFLLDLNKVPWGSAFLYDDADDTWNYWSALYKDILDQHAPIKRKWVRGDQLPWITPQIQREISLCMQQIVQTT